MNIKLGKAINISIEVPSLDQLESVSIFSGGNFTAKNGVFVRISPKIPSKPGVYFLIAKAGHVSLYRQSSKYQESGK